MHFNVTNVTFGATSSVVVCQTMDMKTYKIFPTAFHGFAINVAVQILVVLFLLLRPWIYQIRSQFLIQLPNLIVVMLISTNP